MTNAGAEPAERDGEEMQKHYYYGELPVSQQMLHDLRELRGVLTVLAEDKAKIGEQLSTAGRETRDHGLELMGATATATARGYEHAVRLLVKAEQRWHDAVAAAESEVAE